MRYPNLGTVIDNVYPKKDLNSIRPSTRGLVFNEKNEVALLHIVGDDNFGHRDHYEFPGGGLEENESFSSCFKREIREELGVEIDEPIILGMIEYDFNLIGLKNISMVLTAKIVGKANCHLTDVEQDLFKEILYVPLNKAIELLSDPKIENVGKLISERELKIINAYIKYMKK